MAHAVHAVHQQVIQGRIASEDVTADTIEQELYTQVCPTAKSASTDASLLFGSKPATFVMWLCMRTNVSYKILSLLCHKLHLHYLLSVGHPDEAEGKICKSASYLVG